MEAGKRNKECWMEGVVVPVWAGLPLSQDEAVMRRYPWDDWGEGSVAGEQAVWSPLGPACVVGRSWVSLGGERGPITEMLSGRWRGRVAGAPSHTGLLSSWNVATTHSISKTPNGSKNVNFQFLHGSHVEMVILWRYRVKIYYYSQVTCSILLFYHGYQGT